MESSLHRFERERKGRAIVGDHGNNARVRSGEATPKRPRSLVESQNRAATRRLSRFSSRLNISSRSRLAATLPPDELAVSRIPAFLPHAGNREIMLLGLSDRLGILSARVCVCAEIARSTRFWRPLRRMSRYIAAT